MVLLGCAREGAPPAVEVGPHVVDVSAVGLTSVVVTDAAGLVLARRDVDGLAALSVDHGAAPGQTITVAVAADPGSTTVATVPSRGPFTVTVDVPSGQGARPMAETLPFTVIAGEATATIVVASDRVGPIDVTVDDVVYPVVVRVPGERAVLTVPVAADGVTTLEIRGAGITQSAILVPTRLSPEDARARLTLAPVAFPATPTGAPEPTRAAGRVTLPAGWWSALVRATGLGTRGRDRQTPWSYQGIRLTNSGPDPLNVVVRAGILEPSGAPAAAFRPQVRESAGGTGVVSALLRVPAHGEATAALPLFVDDTALAEGSSAFLREVTVTPLGSSAPLHQLHEPLHVRRGSTWVSLGFLLGMIGALGGVLLVTRRLRGWLGEARTADLTTVAVFATLAFLVATAAAVLAGAVGAVLGPFQTFATNLLDDALRYALLATLITLLPRPGIAALSVLVTWLMRGVVLGGFTPIDVLFVGNQVFWLESCLWLAGLTRGGGHVDVGFARRWVRLGLGFASASLLTAISGLALSMVLYRLYYAGWYVAALLALPGFLYVWIACGLATGFARSLRQVER